MMSVRLLRQGFASLLVLTVPASLALSAPDDIDAKPNPNQLANNQFFMDDNNLEQNVFQPHGSAKQARVGIESRLKMQIDDVDRTCGLTEVQRKKLKLAGSNDVRRFFDEFEAIRKKYRAGHQDQQAWNNIWQEIQPLQTRLAGGLFGENSFYTKSIRQVLSDEQFIKYDAVYRERRKFRYRACIEVVFETLENSVPMKDSQREALIAVILEETQPPLAFGQHNQQVVMYNLSKVDEAKLKAVLDERQWKLMQVQINQSRGWEQFLVQNGLITKEEVEARKPKPRVKKLIRPAAKLEQKTGPADAIVPENN